jgi:hypothetical protein
MIEIARCFGDGVKGASLQAQMSRHLTPNVKIIHDALARGDDPATIPLGNLYGSYKKKAGEGETGFPSVNCTFSFRLRFQTSSIY